MNDTAPWVVPATVGDAMVLGRIHANSFPVPWSTDDFALFLRQSEVFGWITGTGNEPEAFVLFRRVVDEAEIMTLAVVPQRRRNGMAARLLHHALDELRQRGTTTCYLEVAVDNVAARALYASIGFVACGRRRGYYDRPGEKAGDAIVMRHDL